jgi:hypothetical protein
LIFSMSTLPGMRVVAEVDGDADLVAGLESWLRDRSGLAEVELSRGRTEVGRGELGAAEVLAFIASDVLLPLVLDAVYDFFRDRRRSRPAEQPRVVMTRTDLPGGIRRVVLDVEGPAETVVEVAREVLLARGPGDDATR